MLAAEQRIEAYQYAIKAAKMQVDPHTVDYRIAGHTGHKKNDYVELNLFLIDKSPDRKTVEIILLFCIEIAKDEFRNKKVNNHEK